MEGPSLMKELDFRWESCPLALVVPGQIILVSVPEYPLSQIGSSKLVF